MTHGPAGWTENAGHVFQTQYVTFTPAQLKAISTAPITVVPAPGANKAIVALLAVWTVNFGSAAYTNVDKPALYYGAFGGAIALVGAGGGVVNAAAATASQAQVDSGQVTGASGTGALGTIVNGFVDTSVTSVPLSDIANQPLVLADDQVWASGDSPITLTLVYMIVPTK